LPKNIQSGSQAILQSGSQAVMQSFLFTLSILSGSEIIFGVTIAGFTSAIRQMIWLKKVPLIEESDFLPDL
jgi:hypothetical protein